MFNQIGIYEVKAERKEDFEALMKEEAVFYNSQNGVIAIKVIKNNYIVEDSSPQSPESKPTRLDELTENICYIVYCAYENEATFTNVYKLVREKYYKKMCKLIVDAPKIMLGGNIV